jgi:hypothetical protein
MDEHDESGGGVEVVEVSERDFDADPGRYMALGSYDREVVVRDDEGDLSMIIGGPYDL